MDLGSPYRWCLDGAVFLAVGQANGGDAPKPAIPVRSGETIQAAYEASAKYANERRRSDGSHITAITARSCDPARVAERRRITPIHEADHGVRAMAPGVPFSSITVRHDGTSPMHSLALRCRVEKHGKRPTARARFVFAMTSK